MIPQRSLTPEERAEIRTDAMWELMESACMEEYGTRENTQAAVLKIMMEQADAEMQDQIDNDLPHDWKLQANSMIAEAVGATDDDVSP